MEKYIDFTKLIKVDHNYKDIILRYYQKHFMLTPKYIKISVIGPQPKDTLQWVSNHQMVKLLELVKQHIKKQNNLLLGSYEILWNRRK